MKKLFVFILVGLLMLSLGSPVFAAEQNDTSSSIQESSSLPPLIDGQKLHDLVKAKQSNDQKTNIQNQVVPLGPAPPLSYYQVHAAWSTQHPSWEYFQPYNQYLSVYDHGGEEMYIVTKEIGYGNPSQRQATMNGDSLNLIWDEPFDSNGDGIGDGWYLYWDASGYEDGLFSSQDTSINYPYNTMSDWINIQ